MSEILTNNKYYKDIADTIRQMKGVTTTYKPREMAGALRDIYSTEVEGVPPLTFPSNGNNLLNYRIDGANGGVGDRTKNLANSNEMIQGYWAYANGDFVNANTWICTPKIPCSGNTPYTYQFSNTSRWSGFVFYDENGRYISTSNVQTDSSTEYRTYTATSPSNARYLVINIAGYPGTNDTIRTDDLINFQLEEGSTPTDYEPYGKYKVPVIINGKNLLQNTATSQTISGVTFTVNSDGSVTCNGTASSNAIFAIPVKLNANINYILNGTPENGGVGTYRIDLRTASYSVYNNIIDNGNGAIFTVQENGTYLVSIRIASNYNCNNLTFYPMIRLSSVDNDTYEPYTKQITNIYLDEPIGANESKSLSDTNVNIPTINGTNILSIDTTVQPSNVYVQAPKTNNYNL